MTPGLRRMSAALLAASGLLAVGCAQGGIAGRPMMTGTLKTELARVEQEKQLYSRKVAELEAENTRIANELTQERAFSTDLEARLTDARELLDRRGLAAEPGYYGSPETQSVADWNNTPRARTQPAADSPQSRRKAPFAQISGRIRTVPEGRRESLDPADDELRQVSPAPSSRLDSIGPQTRGGPPVRWLPIAGGEDDNSASR